MPSSALPSVCTAPLEKLGGVWAVWGAECGAGVDVVHILQVWRTALNCCCEVGLAFSPKLPFAPVRET